MEDIYRPFKPKRKTRASIAKEKGLEPLAKTILEQNKKTVLAELLPLYINEEKGVATAEDVIEIMLAGATGVQVGAENLINPYASKQIVEDLPRVMEKYGITSLKDIIGGAH